MIKQRKNETEVHLYSHLRDSFDFSKKWDTKKLTENPNKYIQSILDKSSKSSSGQRGEPDLLYFNEIEKLLILLENKDSIKDHISKSDEKENPRKYAVDGIKHYISFFLEKNIKENKEYFKDFKIIGIAFSGDIEDEYNKKLDTFVIKDKKIENININEFLNEDDYIELFESIDLEKITSDISKSSQEINNQLRIIDSQNRPVLLSALMISLIDKNNNDFRNNYHTKISETIADDIPTIVERILKDEKINEDKIKILTKQLSFLEIDATLRDNSKNILKDILDELKNNVIPLFNKKSNYDIIGKFYEEFLKYAGISNVKKGIVLTPHHITTLFTDLINIKHNDVILDPCCGTGAFLISGMNKIHNIIDKSSLSNKNELKNKIKEENLIGFELNPTMYALAISNMLFRGDGKSKIYNLDFFKEEALAEIKNQKPTIGFINPPYSGKDNKSNPTKKEIQFLERMLDNVSRYGIMIAPLSTYFKDDDIRNRILTKHTLKYVINMPNDLFQPNAMTHTAISVFETNKPHNNAKVIFYDLKDDGFVLSKNKGRTDRLNKWKNIKKEFIEKINNVKKYQDNLSLLKKEIKNDEEWLIQAHNDTDYSDLSNLNFEKSIKEYIIFKTKQDLNLLDKDLDTIDLLEVLNSNNISLKSVLSKRSKNESE